MNEELDPRPICDPVTGLIVRYTDNGLKEGDLEGINQEPKPLELDEHGVPKEWEVPDGDR